MPSKPGPATPAQHAPDPGEIAEDHRVPDIERRIDKGLKQSFPASDPAPINPGSD
jgi:hypothetical protein